MEARSRSIEAWFSMIEQSQVLLPRFQRHEAWRAAQVEGVLENVLQHPSLPVGALLTLDVGSEEPFHSRPIVGAPVPPAGHRPQMHLLDGQQRMTALWRSLNNDYPDMTVFVSLADPDKPDVEIVRRWDRRGVRQPVWADDPVSTFERGFVPISLLRPGALGESRLNSWMASAIMDAEQRMDVFQKVHRLRSRVATYIIPFLSLPVTTDKEVALNVFIKMNTSASPLRDFDIVVAQIEEAMGASLHTMVEDLKTTTPAVRRYGDAEDIVLAIGALLQGRAPLKKTYLERSFGAGLAQIWPDLQRGLQDGLAFLAEEGLGDERRVPTEVAVILVCALWARVPHEAADAVGRARVLIRKVLWRACLTDRYLKTSSTRTYADFKTLSEMISSIEPSIAPDLFDETAYPLPVVDELIKAGWPTRKDRLPRAILAMSLRKGGLDFADGAAATPDRLAQREYHHLFPVSLLGGDRSDERVNRALNCALVTWRTNRVIAANSPREYLEHRTNAASLGEAEVRHRLASHLVPYDALSAGNYSAFLLERADLIAERMTRLANGEDV
jgi:hypothetical protein